MGQSQSASLAKAAPALSPAHQSNSTSGCPMHQSTSTPPPSSSGCPVEHTPPSKPAGGCPIDHSSVDMNPLNQMPSLPQTPLDPHTQSAPLPTDRTMSSIPCRAEDGKSQTWEYPSPQQFYNALVRKGWETPVEHVETMVDIHNFLNERAWEEVLRWEKRVAQFVTCYN